MLLLVGDIGRTVHLQLVKTSKPIYGDEVFCRDNYSTVLADLPIDIYKSPIASMVDDFVKRAPNECNKPEKACFAVPAPIIDNTATLTNFKMTIKVEDLQKALKPLEISKISLINDFESVCYGILALSKSESEDIYPLQSSSTTNNQSDTRRMVVIGAGTGLGEAFVVKMADDIRVYPSEGGHVDFAPRSELEIELLKYLKNELLSNHPEDNQNQEGDEFKVFPHVSVERVVSGSGIARIYQFLQQSKYKKCKSQDIDEAIRTWNYEEKNQAIDKSVNPAAMIVKAALHDKNKLCEKTMEVFLRAFGAEAGNLALRFLPFNGVYLAGSIVPKILSLIDEGLRESFLNGFRDKFLSSFRDKGRMSELVEKIPVYVVLNPDVGIIGATIYAAKL